METKNVETKVEKSRLLRLKKWSQGNSQGPVSLHIYPTDFCNLNCEFCWRPSAIREGQITKNDCLAEAKFDKIIKESKELGALKITISGGGEPLTYPHLVERLQLIKQLSLNGELITNGTLFSERDIKRLVASRWDQIQFSLDGLQDTHDSLRGKAGAFQRSLQAIKKFRDMKEKRGRKKPEIGISMTVCKKNYGQLEDMIQLANKYGVENVSCEPVLPITEEASNITLSERDKIKKHVRRAKKLSEKLNIKSNVENVLANFKHESNNQRQLPTEKPHCFEPWHHMTIQPDGSVGPCCLSHDEPANVKESSLKEIWYGDYFKQLRSDFKQGKRLRYCQDCNVWMEKENERLRTALT